MHSQSVKGTYTIFFIRYENIPSERRKDITYYSLILVDYRPKKDEPKRNLLPVGEISLITQVTLARLLLTPP